MPSGSGFFYRICVLRDTDWDVRLGQTDRKLRAWPKDLSAPVWSNTGALEYQGLRKLRRSPEMSAATDQIS